MPNKNKYKSIALNTESYEKLQSIAATNNRAKNRELAGMIEEKYQQIFIADDKKPSDTVIGNKLNTSDDFIEELIFLIKKYEDLGKNQNNSAFVTRILVTMGIDRLFELSAPNPMLAISCLLMAIESKVDHVNGLTIEGVNNVH